MNGVHVIVALVALAAGVSALPTPADSHLHTLHKLTNATADGARCLDGSPGAYYLRPGWGDGANKWYVHHEGGGWCESLDDCLARSRTTLGSSTEYHATNNMTTYSYFATDPAVNPQLYNWNSVFIKYCDGGSFSGDNATVTTVHGSDLYFRGHRVLHAVMDALERVHDIGKATDVVVSGCSAGGLATYLHADEWAARLPNGAKVVAMPDSGFFLALDTDTKNYKTALRWVFGQMNATSGVNRDCVAAYAAQGEQWRCIFAQYTAPHIRTPLFALQSVYDAWQLPNILGTTSDVAKINAFGALLLRTFKEAVLATPGSSGSLSACSYHCNQWDKIYVNGRTHAMSFWNWYGGSPDPANVEERGFPCHDCCVAH